MKVPKTKNNPHGISNKQKLVLEVVKGNLNKGKPIKMVEAVEKVYDVKNRASAHSVVSRNMHNPNFREALIESLTEKRILGADSKTEDRLVAGLDAENKDGSIDYDVRLKYIQEINKIAGVYAPETRKNLNLNLDMSEEELDKKIAELKEQTKS